MLLGIHGEDPYREEIECSLHKEMACRNFFFHLFIIAFEMVMLISISLRPGGPFAKPRRIAYFLLYLILILVTAGVTAAQAYVGQKTNRHRTYFRIENAYMVFFSLWGIAITLNDQLGGNGLTVYTYVILILAIMSMIKPWKIALLIAFNFTLLNILLPYFPDPNGLDNTYNNLMNSMFLSLAAIVIAMNFYNSKIQAKRDEIIIKNQYRQIEEINGKLRKEALMDALTGLGNRTSYHKALQALEKKDGGILACIYIDVNGLHEINNQSGHDAGDRMLCTVAAVLLETFRFEEVFRIGGDEFVVLCSDIAHDGLVHKIESLTAEIEKRGYSLSLGYEWRDLELDINEIIRAAETAMQRNKSNYYMSINGSLVRKPRDIKEIMEKESNSP